MTTQRDAAARRSRLLVLVPAQVSLMVGLGLLVTRNPVADLLGPVEDRVSHTFAAHRAPPADAVSGWLSMAAGTQAIVAVTLVCVAALLVLPGPPRWAEAVFLGASVAVQSAVFLVVTVCVERPRPAVPHLDAAPPTSSFPSGHVGASVALFGGLALLALTRLRGPRRYVTVAALLLVPPLVGLSRLYRGMHHPTDVVGGLVNGALTLLVVGSVFLAGRAPGGAADDHRRRPSPSGAAPGIRTAGQVVVVRHPHACDDRLADRVRAVLTAHGHPDQRWTLTTAEQPCGELAEACDSSAPSRDGPVPGRVDLVVACGGDGTVRACADVVAGTDIALAVVPCGTGNLLARNLGLPLDPATALEEALGGDCFGIDVGRVRGDGLGPTRFTVMTGAGFDAAMVRDASPRLKARLGWAAYLLAAARHLRDPRTRVSLRVDGGRRRRHRARMIVVGNVGTLQGGVELLPGARADSGRLDVVLFDPDGAAGWLAVTGHLVSRVLRRRSTGARQVPGPAADPETGGRSVAGGALTYYRGRHIDIRFAGAQPREIDGDTVADGRRLTVETEPGALRVRLPRAPGPAAVRPAAPAPRRTRRSDGAHLSPGAPNRPVPPDVLAPLAPRHTQSGS
ncbi:diacylglycerol kinase family protein [Streptomyces sp. NPDC047434]|uniref:diacylglycerol kinase family protein n=1 Tax=Streptomyces sp. NPDC047434 TaxID=3155143 RepID=UPI0034098213